MAGAIAPVAGRLQPRHSASATTSTSTMPSRAKAPTRSCRDMTKKSLSLPITRIKILNVVASQVSTLEGCNSAVCHAYYYCKINKTMTTLHIFITSIKKLIKKD
jgi:hypothetical protein